MGKGICTMLFVTIVVFMYKASFMTAGQEIADWARWVALALLCLFVLTSPAQRPDAYRGGGVRAFAFAFAGIGTISCLWSQYSSLRTFQRGVSMGLLAAFIFLAVWPRLRTVKDYAALTAVFSAAAWLSTGLSAAAVFAAPGLAVRPFTRAVQGIFGNPNMLGMVFAVLTPVAVARFHHRPGLIRLALPLMMGLLLAASQSRAGMLGALFGTGAFYAQYYGRRIWIALIVALCIGAPVVILRDQGNVLDEAEQGLVRQDETSLNRLGSGRIGLWLIAYQRFKERPLTGYGLGTGGDKYMPNGEPFRWHSSFTQIAVELGVVGLFFFAAPMVFAAAKVARHRTAEIPSARTRALVGGLTGGWFGGAVDSFFESWLFSAGNIATIFAWLCFAAGMKGISDAPILSEEDLRAHER